MKITILGSGTSTGVPEIGCECIVCQSKNSKDKRLRASVLVETNQGNSILIDCGPDFRTQMLDNKINKLDTLLITHIHYDHLGGIDDLRPFCKFRPFELFASESSCCQLKEKYSYIFNGAKYPGIPNLELN